MARHNAAVLEHDYPGAMSAALDARDHNTTRRAAVSCHFEAPVTTALTGTKLVPSGVVNRLPAVLLAFSAGELAQAGEATKEAAKSWRNGTRFPHGPHLLNMGRKILRVRQFIHGEIDPPSEALTPHEVVANCFAQLNQMSQEPGQVGAEARAVLAKLMGNV